MRRLSHCRISDRAPRRFFNELRKSRRIDLVLARHEPRTDPVSGRKYHVEKETDVNLAADMVVAAYTDRCDIAMLVAGDTDYVRAVKAVQECGKKLVWCHLPSRRGTHQPAQICDERRELDETFLRTCMM